VSPAGGRRRLRLVLLPIAVCEHALLGVMGVRLWRGDQSLGEVKLQPYAAPDFALTLFDGDRFALDQQHGKVVVLNFWASWCDPCKTEAPALESVWQRYRDDGVVFVGIDIKDTPEDARSFLERHAASYPNGFDSQKQIYIDYGVYGLPETFVVDPRGMVVHHAIGPVTSAQLERWLDPLVATRPPAG
jgi:cytochrome c biogenesis protein CcmG/thiol:disulfide interchange protein DsbE